jgi:uncharacterized protein YjbI with pentapeptide repeats
MIDLNLLLATLANKRPVFHSEADFQHALAWELQLLDPNVNIRLEYRPPWLDRRNYMDIWVIDEDTATAIELKYKTRSVDISIGGEQFALQNHAAQDLGRYDFVKDIERLERVVAAGRQVVGYAIILTNDPTYWSLPGKSDSVDANLGFADLRQADLTGTNLADAYLSGANLTDANLSGANLTGATMVHTNLTGVDLSEVKLSRKQRADAIL